MRHFMLEPNVCRTRYEKQFPKIAEVLLSRDDIVDGAAT